MAWTEPQHTPEQVNAAGKLVTSAYGPGLEEWDDAKWGAFTDAVRTVDNWRSAHAYPLNHFQIKLRQTARRFEDQPLVAQRIKRLISIVRKLRDRPKMKLSQMQDLGGCRAILETVENVYAVADYYLGYSGGTRALHELSSIDDYIWAPKSSGYRGIHLVYRYAASESKAMYGGMKVELQIRSKFQHAWATAVEVVDMFSVQGLKAGKGDKSWARFFALMGSVIALREGCPVVPGTSDNKDKLTGELRKLAQQLNAEHRFREYGRALDAIRGGAGAASLFLLKLYPSEGRLSITGYKKVQIEVAQEAYAEAEKEARGRPEVDVVLVSVESAKALARAYPNYFADTRVFVELMNQALRGKSRGIRVADLDLPLSSEPSPVLHHTVGSEAG